MLEFTQNLDECRSSFSNLWFVLPSVGMPNLSHLHQVLIILGTRFLASCLGDEDVDGQILAFTIISNYNERFWLLKICFMLCDLLPAFERAAEYEYFRTHEPDRDGTVEDIYMQLHCGI